MKGSGTKIPKADRDILDSYRELRNYFEHVEEQLTAIDPEVGVVTIIDDELVWRFRVEIPRDSQGKFVTKSGMADVSTRGLKQFEQLVIKYWNRLESDCLGQVEKYFRENPGKLPDPSAIDRRSLFVHDICHDGSQALGG